jgi:type VI secretion system protein
MSKGLMLLAATLSMLSGCSSDTLSTSVKSVLTMQTAKVWLNKVSFRAADDLNDSSPVTLHIVIPYTADLYTSLTKMSAEDYFRKADQIKLDNTGNIDVFSWDLIRSQSLNDEQISPSKLSGEGVIVFARYSSPGDHRVTIADDETVVIRLNKSDFLVELVKQ